MNSFPIPNSVFVYFLHKLHHVMLFLSTASQYLHVNIYIQSTFSSFWCGHAHIHIHCKTRCNLFAVICICIPFFVSTSSSLLPFVLHAYSFTLPSCHCVFSTVIAPCGYFNCVQIPDTELPLCVSYIVCCVQLPNI